MSLPLCPLFTFAYSLLPLCASSLGPSVCTNLPTPTRVARLAAVLTSKGIPDQRPLQEGDIVNLDVSLFHGGMHGDLNGTYPVGKIDPESADLIATTKQSMEEAIKICKPGVAYREIGNKIESITKPKGYGVVRRYTGHGIHYQVCCFTRDWRGAEYRSPRTCTL